MNMELQERISILTQGAELAQKAGILTLAEASLAKQAIDALNNNVSHKSAFEILIKIALKGQKNGAYTLRDAYFLYLASENIESAVPQPEPAPEEKKTRTKKES